MGVRRARGSCACVAGRGGRRESGKQGRQVWWPCPRSSSHDSHGVGGGTHSRPQAQTDTRARRGRPGDWLSQCRGAWSWLLPIYPVWLPPRLAAGTGASSLGAHDLAGPRLVGSVWSQLGEHHLHGLELLVLGRDRAHLVGHLVAFHWHVLPLDAGGGRGCQPRSRPPPWMPPVVWPEGSLALGLVRPGSLSQPPFSEPQFSNL